MNVSPEWAMWICLAATCFLTYLVADELIRRSRAPKKNEWKKPAAYIPQQRGPRGMTREGRQLYMAAYQVPASAPTETSEEAA